jgi:adenylate cyclase
VGGNSRDDVAARAGVDAGYVDRLVELGIVRPPERDGFSGGDVRRARWVRALDVAGVPLERLATAVRDGTISLDYLDASAFDQFAEVSGTTFRELSESTGIPMELLKVVREAVGFAEARPDDRVREDELAITQMLRLQLSRGVRPVVIERWLRVCADSLRRIAETETDWWRSEVEMPLLESGMSTTQMLETQAEFGSQLAPFMEQLLLAIYHGQQEHAWTKSAIDDVEAALERAGLLERLHRPPSMCFLDITGYTRVTEERGDEAAAQLAETLGGLVRRTSRDHGGQPVKWLGDGVMFYFPDPGQGVVAALEMVEGVAKEALPPAHVGIHAGPVVFQGGDYFGRTVNIAARIGEYARPGEVLVSQEVVDAAEGVPVVFTQIGPVELRGLTGALTLHSAHRAV